MRYILNTSKLHFSNSVFQQVQTNQNSMLWGENTGNLLRSCDIVYKYHMDTTLQYLLFYYNKFHKYFNQLLYISTLANTYTPRLYFWHISYNWLFTNCLSKLWVTFYYASVSFKNLGRLKAVFEHNSWRHLTCTAKGSSSNGFLVWINADLMDGMQ